MNNMKKRIFYPLSGALTGVINGLFGAGGGLVLVPLLLHGAGMEPKKALPTSVAIILPLSAVSAFQYLCRESIAFSTLIPYLLGGAAGGALAGRYFQNFSILWLRRILGGFILYAGIKAVFQI